MERDSSCWLLDWVMLAKCYFQNWCLLFSHWRTTEKLKLNGWWLHLTTHLVQWCIQSVLSQCTRTTTCSLTVEVHHSLVLFTHFLEHSHHIFLCSRQFKTSKVAGIERSIVGKCSGSMSLIYSFLCFITSPWLWNLNNHLLFKKFSVTFLSKKYYWA